MSFIAQRLNYFDSSDFQRANKKQQELTDPINLSIGVPEELTAGHIKEAGISAIKNDRTVYTPANGIGELRFAIAQKLKQENNIICDQQSITVVPGLTTGLLLVYLAIINPGDEVIVLDPYYPPYPSLATMVGANVVLVSTLPDFQPNLPAIEANITNRTKVLVINTPNNPSGAVYDEKTLRHIAEIAEKHNILVISDEIYEHFVYEKKHFSIGSIYRNTITMNGFSKEYAMTGWRIGYIHGPQDIIDAINEFQQYVVMSSSSIAQHAALEAIKHPPNLLRKYYVKRNLLSSTLDDLGLPCNGLEGAYYAFLKAPHNMSDLEFVERCSEHNLIVVPGRAFSKLLGFFRISYGADLKTLKRGLAVIKDITINS
jgi:aspartate/methionine/tyrosine aminotransferase